MWWWHSFIQQHVVQVINSQILVQVNVVIIACNRVIDARHHNRYGCDEGAAFVRSIAKNGKVRH